MISYASRPRSPTVSTVPPVWGTARACGHDGLPLTVLPRGVEMSMLAQGDDLGRSADEARLRRWRSSLLGLRGEGTERRRAWQTRYVRRIFVIDALIGTVAATAGYVGRFGADTLPRGASIASLWIALLLPFVWVMAMVFARTYEQRFLWVGPEEFRRVFGAAVGLLATVATVSWAFKLEVARGLIVLALPLATLLTLLHRYTERAWLHRRRKDGRFQQTMVIVGHRSGVQALHEQIRRSAYHGYQVVGCCLPPDEYGGPVTSFDGLPVLGDLDSVADVVLAHEIDAVAVLPSRELEGPALRKLGWALEKTEAELLLAPAVTEIVGPRVNIRPLCGLPLLHMERPELRGVRRLMKDTLDRSFSLALLFVLTPALVVIAFAVRLSSRGPVLFRQERVGRDGRRFHMLKFRSMVDGADGMDTLVAENDGNGVLFKLRQDPRVTPVGKVLRPSPLDGRPQLFNVARGEMPRVGPRPPLPSEVEQYGEDMNRRFLVKPGLTGLWQVSG